MKKLPLFLWALIGILVGSLPWLLVVWISNKSSFLLIALAGLVAGLMGIATATEMKMIPRLAQVLIATLLGSFIIQSVAGSDSAAQFLYYLITLLIAGAVVVLKEKQKR